MFNITALQFRLIIVLSIFLWLTILILPLAGIVTFSQDVETARSWNYFDSLAPFVLIQVYWFISAALLIFSCIGMFLFWSPSRWLALAFFLCDFLSQPFLGLLVLPPFEATLTNITSTLFIWVLTVSFWSPLANRFTRNSA